jgi:hypothetical protein
MGLDIRLPIGLLFSVLGLLLAGFGAVSEKGIYERSLEGQLGRRNWPRIRNGECCCPTAARKARSKK